MKKIFIKPLILRELTILSENPVLAASVVDNTTITATGQEVTTYDFGDNSFNHNWGEE